MEKLLDSIRAAVAADASDDARVAGASACRTILSALEATPGQQLGAAPSPESPIATAVSTLRGVPPDQLLDLAIAKLRAALPAEQQQTPVQPVKFQVVTLPRVMPRKR